VTFDLSVVSYGLPLLLGGLVNTMLFSLSAIAIAFVLAPVVAVSRLSRRAWPRWTATCYVEAVRNTPFLVQAFLFFYGLAALGIRVNAVLAGIVTLSIFGTATFSESFRGAIRSVPRGQLESARAVGMPYWLALRRVVFPQMWGYLIPALANQATGIVKECAVLSVITVPEVAMAAQFVIGETFAPAETYAMVAVLYWALTSAITGLIAIAKLLLTRRRQPLVASLGAPLQLDYTEA
jgi:His/Glu/Gln/Arg/opine family amino acid ABC transporter permease subunit